MADGSQEKPYRVLKIDELVRVSDTGGVERYYRHQIRTRAGVVLSVDVLERDPKPKPKPEPEPEPSPGDGWQSLILEAIFTVAGYFNTIGDAAGDIPVGGEKLKNP